MHPVRIELAKLILVGTRITYQFYKGLVWVGDWLTFHQ